MKVAVTHQARGRVIIECPHCHHTAKITKNQAASLPQIVRCWKCMQQMKMDKDGLREVIKEIVASSVFG